MNEIIESIFQGEHADIAVHTLFVAMGYFVAMCISYLKFGAEIAFIKGQLSSIIESQDAVANLVEKSAIMERDVRKAARDLDRVFLRVKILEEEILN